MCCLLSRTYLTSRKMYRKSVPALPIFFVRGIISVFPYPSGTKLKVSPIPAAENLPKMLKFWPGFWWIAHLTFRKMYRKSVPALPIFFVRGIISVFPYPSGTKLKVSPIPAAENLPKMLKFWPGFWWIAHLTFRKMYRKSVPALPIFCVRGIISVFPYPSGTKLKVSPIYPLQKSCLKC